MADAKLATCFWFNTQAEQAAEFYVSLLAGSKIDRVVRSGDGSVVIVLFTLAGVPYQTLNGCPDIRLTEAASISVLTEDQTETDRLWTILTDEGGEEGRCGWLKDRFGLSWQIIPRRASELLSGPEAAKVFPVLMTMRKIDLAALEAAVA